MTAENLGELYVGNSGSLGVGLPVVASWREEVHFCYRLGAFQKVLVWLCRDVRPEPRIVSQENERSTTTIESGVLKDGFRFYSR